MSEDKSKTLLTELLKYAQHGVTCSWHRSSSDNSCTCGFRDLLRELSPLPSSEGTTLKELIKGSLRGDPSKPLQGAITQTGWASEGTVKSPEPPCDLKEAEKELVIAEYGIKQARIAFKAADDALNEWVEIRNRAMRKLAELMKVTP